MEGNLHQRCSSASHQRCAGKSSSHLCWGCGQEALQHHSLRVT